MEFQTIMDSVGKAMDAAGVAAVGIGALAATFSAAGTQLRRQPGSTYETYRRRLGGPILLSPELLALRQCRPAQGPLAFTLFWGG
jgi:hypothetical protein